MVTHCMQMRMYESNGLLLIHTSKDVFQDNATFLSVFFIFKDMVILIKIHYLC
jgi:hypothetical protein